nr:TolC family protein [Novosphingobium sp. ST904]
MRDFEGAASVGMTLRVPLLTGGLVSSRVRQAEANNRAERFQADAAEREAVRGADTAWAMLKAAQGRLRANGEGLSAADLALKGVRAEYGFGLRSTIDILVADQSFRAAQLAVALARSDVLVAEAPCCAQPAGLTGRHMSRAEALRSQFPERRIIAQELCRFFGHGQE